MILRRPGSPFAASHASLTIVSLASDPEVTKKMRTFSIGARSAIASAASMAVADDRPSNVW